MNGIAALVLVVVIPERKQSMPKRVNRSKPLFHMLNV